MNTKKVFYGILTFAVLLIAAACTKSTADDSQYELGIDRVEVTEQEKAIDRYEVSEQETSIDRNEINEQEHSIDRNEVTEQQAEN